MEQQRTIKQVDAAKRYGVTARTLRNWERKGLISGTKVEATRLYRVEQLNKLTGVKG